jgi:hypothetical protein
MIYKGNVKFFFTKVLAVNIICVSVHLIYYFDEWYWKLIFFIIFCVIGQVIFENACKMDYMNRFKTELKRVNEDVNYFKIKEKDE